MAPRAGRVGHLPGHRRFLDELTGVLARPKLRHWITESDAAALIERLLGIADIHPDGASPPRRVRDPHDDYLADATGAALVTGDADLTPPAITPRQLLSTINWTPPLPATATRRRITRPPTVTPTQRPRSSVHRQRRSETSTGHNRQQLGIRKARHIREVPQIAYRARDPAHPSGWFRSPLGHLILTVLRSDSDF